jgi:transposase
MKGHLIMSAKEVNRISIMDKLVKKEIRQKKAAQILGLSVRQIKRLKKRYQQEGAAGLIHKNRGRESNRKIPAEEIDRVIEIVKKEYWDFGPTLAHEKLVENHGFIFGVEALRQAMIKANLWKAKRNKKPRIHQLRERRVCEGELVQIDSSPHAWFENRGPKCDLLGYIDDATSKVKWLEFFPGETTAAYFKATREYLLRYGKPLAFYADKNSIFRINTSRNGSSSIRDSQGLTQFGRAMKQLGIKLIPAHSAQAKGRIEKLFKTLQDRLVKELRLRRIKNIKEANQYLPEFMAEFNDKFAVSPQDPKDAHLPLLPLEKRNLGRILAFQETRILSKNLTCQFENKLYLIKTERPTYAMRHAPVLIIKDLKGKIAIEYKGKKLNYEVIKRQPKQEIIDTKQLNQVIDQIGKQRAEKIPWKSPTDHPWRHFAY